MQSLSIRNRASEPAVSAVDFREAGTNADELENEENRTQPKSVVAVACLQVFLIAFSYSIVIPTARLYAESLNAPTHFEGYVVGAASFGAILVLPAYRLSCRKSWSATLVLQAILLQLGSVLYSLAKIAKKIELLVAGRLIAGFGGAFYPIFQFLAEEVGVRHRSSVVSIVLVGRSLGFALGPAVAAVLVYVDFNVGDLAVDKETNGGWTVAIACGIQIILIVAFFPRGGGRGGGREHRRVEDTRPIREKLMYYGVLGFLSSGYALPNFCITGWEVHSTELIQVNFGWSLTWSALLVGGIALTPALTCPVMGKYSYKHGDRKILLWWAAIQCMASVTLFNFGPQLPWFYLAGSLVYINAVTLQTTFSVSLSSKVCLPHHIEAMQGWTNAFGLLLRGLGAVVGASLDANGFAGVCAAASLFSFVGTVVFYRRMKISLL